MLTTRQLITVTLLATTGFAAPAAAQKVQAFVSDSTRESTQAMYFTSNEGSFAFKGTVSIHYGAPDWKESYAKAIAQPDKRHRLGKDGWTTLDTNVALQFGDTAVKPGTYYLALEANAKGAPHLVLLDANEIRPKKTMPNDTAKTTGGITVPLKSSTPTDDENVAQLRIRLTTDETDVAKTRLTLRWGSLMMTADMVAKLDDAD